MVRHYVQRQTFIWLNCSVEQVDVLVPKRFTGHAAHCGSRPTYRVTLPCSQRSLCWLVQLWGAYSWSLWSLSCSPMFHQVKRNLLPVELWTIKGKRVWGPTRVSRKLDLDEGNWNREGCKQRWMLQAVPGNRDKILRTHSSFKEDISSRFWPRESVKFVGELNWWHWQGKSMRPLDDT